MLIFLLTYIIVYIYTHTSPVAPYTHEVCTLWYRAPEILLGSPTYGASADMWGIGCIFAEMLSGKPIFPGQGEPDQINRIFRTLGSPNEVNWPGVSTLPNASKVSYKVGSRSKLRELFPLASFSGGMSLSESGFDLLSRLLCMDPARVSLNMFIFSYLHLILLWYSFIMLCYSLLISCYLVIFSCYEFIVTYY